jgi:5-formyltetrahydrofolate cyclo-ligase
MIADSDIERAKIALRREMRQRLARLTAEAREARSRALHDRLLAEPRWQDAEVILGFCPMSTEPDILPTLRDAVSRGRVVALPRWSLAAGVYEPAVWSTGDPLHAGPFGVLEPLPEARGLQFEQLDLILVPGLAFDPCGRRLGRGRGFFDRLLSRASRAEKWGVAFDSQLVPAVPCAPHDANVDAVVTPGQFLPTPGGGKS